MFPRLLAFILLACSILPAYAQSAPVCVVGAVGGPTTATLTFNAPTTNVDGTAIATPLTYNLYQSVTSTAETKVASALKGSPIAVTTGLAAKTTFYWKVSVTDANGVESALSAEVCKTFPASPPGTVINLTIS